MPKAPPQFIKLYRFLWFKLIWLLFLTQFPLLCCCQLLWPFTVFINVNANTAPTISFPPHVTNLHISQSLSLILLVLHWCWMIVAGSPVIIAWEQQQLFLLLSFAARAAVTMAPQLLLLFHPTCHKFVFATACCLVLHCHQTVDCYSAWQLFLLSSLHCHGGHCHCHCLLHCTAVVCPQQWCCSTAVSCYFSHWFA